MWRKQNLSTFRIAKLARARCQQIHNQHLPVQYLVPLGEDDMDPAEREERRRAADQQARQELGDVYALVESGDAAEIEGLMNELDVTRASGSTILVNYLSAYLFTPDSGKIELLAGAGVD